MLHTILRTLPLEIASALSPGILAFSLIILSGNIQPKLKCLIFFAGNLVIAVLIAVLGLTAGGSIISAKNPSLISSIVDLVIATLFFFYGIYTLLKVEKPTRINEESNSLYIKLFLIGILISITNFDAVILYFTATKEIGISSLNSINKVIAVAIGGFFFLSPVAVPLIFYLIAPKFARKILEPVDRFTKKYARYIIGIIFVVFAIYFYIKGFKYF